MFTMFIYFGHDIGSVSVTTPRWALPGERFSVFIKINTFIWPQSGGIFMQLCVRFSALWKPNRKSKRRLNVTPGRFWSIAMPGFQPSYLILHTRTRAHQSAVKSMLPFKSDRISWEIGCELNMVSSHNSQSLGRIHTLQHGCYRHAHAIQVFFSF